MSRGKFLNKWVRLTYLIYLCTIFCDTVRAEEGRGVLFQLEDYRPLYFVAGRADTKIEVSFKVKLLDDANLYFGYSQLMIWNLFQKSPYFKDINYNPEVFYRFLVDGNARQWVDASPLEHESNGRGFASERSWNRAYVRYHNEALFGEDRKIFYSFKGWFAYGLNENNQDITQYRGLWETEITLADFLGDQFERSDLTFRLYPGGRSSLDPFRGGQQLLLQIKGKTGHLPLVVLEAFHGYGEYLLAYKEDVFALRAGVGF